MAEIHIPYLPTAKFFKIRCRLGIHEQDIASDTDSDPQIRTIGGTVTIATSVKRFRYTESDGRARVVYLKPETYTIQTATGELFDADGNAGVHLLDTTSPGVDPQGWTYTATVRPEGGEPFDAVIPSGWAGEAFDLGDGLVFSPSTGITDLETRVKALEDAGGTSIVPGSLDTEGVQDIVGAMVTGAGGTYDDAAGTITLPAGGGGTTGPLAMFSALPASPVQWQPYEYRYTEATAWPGGIVWASGQPATLGWGIATLVWDGARWCGEWTTMHGTNTAGEGTNYAPTVTLLTPTKTNLQVSQSFTVHDPEGMPVTVTADWGDGTALEVVTSPAVHTYELNGVYTAWFTPSDGTQDGAPVSGSYQVTSTDTDLPTPGTLAASNITTDGFTLTVTGAADNAGGVGLHARPFRFSTDNGTTMTAWQASPSYAASGLLSGQNYTCLHQTRDAVGNAATGASVVVTTAGAAATLADAIIALSPSVFYKFDETTGTTITDYSGNGRHGTLTGTAGTDYVLANKDGHMSIPNGVGRVVVPDDDVFTFGANGMSWFGLNTISSWKSQNIMGKPGEWKIGVAGERLEAGGISSSGRWVNSSQTPEGAFTPYNIWSGWAVTMSTRAAGVAPKFYLGSGTAQEFAVSGTATPGGNNVSNLEIGGLWGAYAYYAIFPRQLTAGEIGNLMALAKQEGRIP